LTHVQKSMPRNVFCRIGCGCLIAYCRRLVSGVRAAVKVYAEGTLFILR